MVSFYREEREYRTKNMLNHRDGFNLDIPPWMSSVVDYRASLGHKVGEDFALDLQGLSKF